MNVGELRKMLEGVPDDAVVALNSDGNGEYAAYLFDGDVEIWDAAGSDGLGVNDYEDDEDFEDSSCLMSDEEKVVAVIFPGDGASRY